jgi:hypothetical protein
MFQNNVVMKPKKFIIFFIVSSSTGGLRKTDMGSEGIIKEQLSEIYSTLSFVCLVIKYENKFAQRETHKKKFGNKKLTH